ERHPHHHPDGPDGTGQGAGAPPGGVSEGRRRGQERQPRVADAEGNPSDNAGRETGLGWGMRERWIVYVLRCAGGSLYTGITNDLTRRLERHRAGTASAFTRSRRPVRLVYQERQPTRSAALRREAALRSLSRPEKLALVLGKGGGSVVAFSRYWWSASPWSWCA